MKKSMLDKLEKSQLELAEERVHYCASAIIGHRAAIGKRLNDLKKTGALFRGMRSGAHRVKLTEALAALEQLGVALTSENASGWRTTDYNGSMPALGKVTVSIGFNSMGPVVAVRKTNENRWGGTVAIEIKWSTKRMLVYNRSLDVTLRGKD